MQFIFYWSYKIAWIKIFFPDFFQKISNFPDFPWPPNKFPDFPDRVEILIKEKWWTIHFDIFDVSSIFLISMFQTIGAIKQKWRVLFLHTKN